MFMRPPRSTRPGPRLPYTTLLRSVVVVKRVDQLEQRLRGRLVGDLALQRRAPGQLDAFGLAQFGLDRLGDLVQAVDPGPDVVAVLGRFANVGAGVERRLEHSVGAARTRRIGDYNGADEATAATPARTRGDASSHTRVPHVGARAFEVGWAC